MCTRFELILENKRTSSYRKLTRLIVFLNIAAFAFFAFNADVKWKSWIAMSVAAVLALLLMMRVTPRVKAGATLMMGAGFDFIFIALAWTVLSVWWAAALGLLIYFFYNIARKPLLVSFTPDEIRFPAFPTRSIRWNELTNALLKDNLLTIDFKNNRIIQQMLDKHAKAADEQEFNDFCSKQISQAQSSQT